MDVSWSSLSTSSWIVEHLGINQVGFSFFFFAWEKVLTLDNAKKRGKIFSQ